MSSEQTTGYESFDGNGSNRSNDRTAGNDNGKGNPGDNRKDNGNANGKDHGKHNRKKHGKRNDNNDVNQNANQNTKHSSQERSRGGKKVLLEYQFTAKDYEMFRSKLWSDETPPEELQEICMLLAHVTTAEARELVENFRASDRATEVDWLDEAVEDGKYHYLSPRNDLEERDFMALRVLCEMMDDIVQLEIDFNDARILLEKLDIEQEAIKELVRRGEMDKSEEIAMHPLMERSRSKMENIAAQIDIKDKVYDYIKKSIQTERYKSVDPVIMRDIHYR